MDRPKGGEGSIPLLSFMKLIEALKGQIVSTSEGKRIVTLGAVKVNDETVSDLNVEVKKGDVIQVGKFRKWIVNFALCSARLSVKQMA